MKHFRKSFFPITVLFAGFFLSLSAIPSHGQWAATYGGASNDIARSVLQTADGGYIVAGYTQSFGAGSYDVWVLKLDSTGVVTWQKRYGGTAADYVTSIQQTADGGYIVAGTTESFGAGSGDIWIMKLDATGAVAWQKTYGGLDSDSVSAIQQTADGGYIVAGYTSSYGTGDTDTDAWVLKLDSTGVVTWQKTYGDANSDYAYSIQQTADGGYIVAGATKSFGAGSYDGWILKLAGDGNVSWQKTYGAVNLQEAYLIQQTQDNGYIVAGGTYSSVTESTDAWVLKLDSTGAITWQKTYGGQHYDYAFSIQQTQDGGYIVAGYTYSFGTGNDDAWVLKLDNTGAVAWQKTYGGAGFNCAYSIQQTQDGGYIVAGWHQAFAGHNSDAFIYKIDSSGNIGSCPFERVATAAMSDTTVTGVDTSVVPANTTVTGVDSTAGVSDTSATSIQWCPLTEDTQRLKVGATRKKKGEGSIVSAEGLIACPGTCQQDYNEGLTVTLYADPSDLSTFLGWKPTSLECEGTDPCQVTMNKKKTVKAVFQGPNKLKVVTTFKKGGTGSVASNDTFIACPGDCEELYKLGTSVALTATPGDNSYFVKWTGKPCKDIITNECTFAMDKNYTVKAIFQINPE